MEELMIISTLIGMAANTVIIYMEYERRKDKDKPKESEPH
jgi:hypothetical protein